jgi:Dna[CI] antecedent, DciA
MAFKQNPTKREELKTYATLGFKRTLKSSSQRRRMLARGAQIILGGGTPHEPEIAVLRHHYNAVRLLVLQEHLQRAKTMEFALSREQLLDHLSPVVDRETYRRILGEEQAVGRLEEAFQQTYARRPTEAEQRLFQAPQAVEIVAKHCAHRQRAHLLGEVLAGIEGCRENSGSRLQSVWAEVVGEELAQQSQLEKVEAGIAWFRCLNSALSYHLQRKPELAVELARKLGLPVRQLRASY